MRPGRVSPMTITRRALGTRIAGAAAALGFGTGAATSLAASPMPVMDPDLRDAALRGLALAGHRGDPVTAAAANAALARLAETDPEAGLLGRIYQMLDVRPAAYWPWSFNEKLPNRAMLARFPVDVMTNMPITWTAGETSIALTLRACRGAVCAADGRISSELAESLLQTDPKAETLFSLTRSDGSNVAIPLSLTGFAEAWAAMVERTRE